MEKFIPLQKANVGKIHHGNKDLCGHAGNNQLIPKQAIAGPAGENNSDILQLYYAALIQSLSPGILKNQDNCYLHCT
jgi:hypothetical protein